MGGQLHSANMWGGDQPKELKTQAEKVWGPLHDFSDQGMEGSMRAAVAHLRDWYVFGAHKEIDFDAIEAKVVPMAAQASADGSPELFAEACLTLTSMLPDGHVTFNLCDEQEQMNVAIRARDAALGGAFGFTLNEDDDGNAVVTWAHEDAKAK